jgi:hypothetical protein
MVKAKRAHKVETLKQTSLDLKLHAPHFYPDHMSDPDTYMYHHKLAPQGKIFRASEVQELQRQGWVDSPAKFPPPSKFASLLASSSAFWRQHWQFIITTLLTIIGIVVAALAL